MAGLRGAHRGGKGGWGGARSCAELRGAPRSGGGKGPAAVSDTGEGGAGGDGPPPFPSFSWVFFVFYCFLSAAAKRRWALYSEGSAVIKTPNLSSRGGSPPAFFSPPHPRSMKIIDELINSLPPPPFLLPLLFAAQNELHAQRPKS